MAESFNVDGVRRAWEARESARRDAYRQAKRAISAYDTQTDQASPEPEALNYRYVREVWSDFVIVENDMSPGLNTTGYMKVPFTVDSNSNVQFGAEVPVKIEYVALSAGEPLWVDALTDSATDNLLQLASIRSYTRVINGKTVQVRAYARKGGNGGSQDKSKPTRGGSPYTGAGNASSRTAPKGVKPVVDPKKETSQAAKTATKLLKQEIQGFDPVKITQRQVMKAYYSAKPSVRNALRILYPAWVGQAVKTVQKQKQRLSFSESTDHGDAVLKLMGNLNG